MILLFESWLDSGDDSEGRNRESVDGAEDTVTRRRHVLIAPAAAASFFSSSLSLSLIYFSD
jgi:hypothetical protein